MSDHDRDKPTCPICGAAIVIQSCSMCGGFGYSLLDGKPCDECKGRHTVRVCSNLPHTEAQMAAYQARKKATPNTKGANDE